jgi:putative Ca2+/H+ antiporter (TMEM165/GDT1 family)
VFLGEVAAKKLPLPVVHGIAALIFLIMGIAVLVL